MQKFWEEEVVKKYLIVDLFDVDEIVREYSNFLMNEDYKMVRRYYYTEFVIVKEPHKIKYTTKEDFELNKNNENSERHYFTELNYEDFINVFAIESFQTVLCNQYEPDIQRKFISCVEKTFHQLKKESQGELFLKNVLDTLSQSINQLLDLKKQNSSSVQVNVIQGEVITVFTNSYLEAMKKISKKFMFTYPEIGDETVA